MEAKQSVLEKNMGVKQELQKYFRSEMQQNFIKGNKVVCIRTIRNSEETRRN